MAKPFGTSSHLAITFHASGLHDCSVWIDAKLMGESPTDFVTDLCVTAVYPSSDFRLRSESLTLHEKRAIREAMLILLRLGKTGTV